MTGLGAPNSVVAILVGNSLHNSLESKRIDRAGEDCQHPSRPLHSLVFAGHGLDHLRRDLLAAHEETAAFVLAAPVRTPAGAWRLIVREIVHLEARDYARRTPDAIELPPDVVARVMQRARVERLSIVVAHSHPTGGEDASAADREGEARLVPALSRRVPGLPHGRLIVAPTGSCAAIFLPIAEGDSFIEEPAELVQVGREITWPVGSTSRVADASQIDSSANPQDSLTDDNRFDRQVRAFGPGGQAVLAGLRVAIVGVGGTGSFVVQELAHLGVGAFLLIDHDSVDSTSLNRLSGATPSDVGRAKVDVASNAIRAINPRAVIETIRGDVCTTDVARRLLDVDCFFSCTDSHGSRWVLTRLAYQHFLPGFDIGVVIRAHAGRVTHIAGRVQMLAPGLACLACGTELDPEQVRRDLLTEAQRAADPYIVGAGNSAGVQPSVMSINGVAASLAVTMFLSAVTGIPNAARYQRLRLDSGTVTHVDATPRNDCVVCSVHGFFATGDAGGAIGRPAI